MSISCDGIAVGVAAVGLSVKDGLRTWTALSTIAGLVGFLLTAAMWLVV